MHSSEHEQWYAALALGERDVPPGARDELAQCDVCASRADELDAVRAELERASAQQRAVLRGARDGGDVPGAAAAEKRLREAIAATGRAPARRLWPMVAAAAALIVGAIAVSTFMSREPNSPGRAPGVLGESSFTGLAPRDAWSAGVPLTWHYPLPARGWFVVRLHAPDRPNAFAESPRLEHPQWNPSEDERAPWPNALEWQVTAYDASGRALDSSPLVSLSRR